MLQAFVIAAREGVEAFLIVAIMVAYLRKTGRARLVGAVRWGVLVAVVVSVGAGALLEQAANHSLWEAILGAAAAVLVASLTVYMLRAGKRMRHDIEARLESRVGRLGEAGFLGVFLFTVFMMTREGMETALLFSTLLFQVKSAPASLGAVLGVGLAAIVAWLWSRYGHRVQLGRFLQVTAVFLLVFVVQLVVYSFHELTEAGVIPNSEALHLATEPYGPDGTYGQYLSYLLVALPLAWLAVSSFPRGDGGSSAEPRNGVARAAPHSGLYMAPAAPHGGGRGPQMVTQEAHAAHPDWRERGVRVVHANELDPNTPQTPGMKRAAAIHYAVAGAEKLWAGSVVIDAKAKTGPHHHGPLESIIYVVSGRARMRWGEALEFTAEAGPGDFIFVPPFVPHQEINASATEPLQCVIVRSGQEPVVVNLDIAAVEQPDEVEWVDPAHPPRPTSST